MGNVLEKIIGYGDNILFVLLTFVIGLVLVKVLLYLIKKVLQRTKLDEAMHRFIIRTFQISLYLVLGAVILIGLGVPSAPLITVLGAAGGAIAFALKDSLGNIAAGIIILAHRGFGKGDEIEVQGKTGVVEAIDVMMTTIKTLDNKVITIPNSLITSSVFVNYSKEPIRRVDIDFTISYESDYSAAKNVLMAVAKGCEGVLDDPEPVVLINGYLDSAVGVTLRAWCETPNYYPVKMELVEQVGVAFAKADITIPYPQLDVHVVK